MKKQFYPALFITLVFLLMNSCCHTALYGGLNRENENCDRGKSVYSDVFVSKGDLVYICWSTSDDVDDVTLTDFGSVGKEGSKTVTADVDKSYKLVTIGGKCERTLNLNINVVEEGESLTMTASNETKKDLVWHIKYPSGQVSPNIMATSIEPLCYGGCYPIHPVEGFNFLSCGQKLCNGAWSGQKVNLNGGGLPNGFQISSSRTFLPPNIPLVGDWYFSPPINLDREGDQNGQASFKVTAACIE